MIQTPESLEKIQAVVAANETLSDVVKRKIYDHDLQEIHHNIYAEPTPEPSFKENYSYYNRSSFYQPAPKSSPMTKNTDPDIMLDEGLRNTIFCAAEQLNDSLPNFPVRHENDHKLLQVLENLSDKTATILTVFAEDFDATIQAKYAAFIEYVEVYRDSIDTLYRNPEGYDFDLNNDVLSNIKAAMSKIIYRNSDELKFAFDENKLDQSIKNLVAETDACLLDIAALRDQVAPKPNFSRDAG
jgi:hypothetical protein